MAFREKSAWAMAAVMLLTGLFYAWQVARAGAVTVLPTIISYTIAVIVLSVVVQIALALANRREAAAPRDERERLAIALAGHRSGLALAAMVATSATIFALIGRADLLFHLIIGSLILAQLYQYSLEACLLRRGF
jgi:divalent metal cation (Fe/Co/Zn/Cd) transporter